MDAPLLNTTDQNHVVPPTPAANNQILKIQPGNFMENIQCHLIGVPWRKNPRTVIGRDPEWKDKWGCSQFVEPNDEG